MNTKTINIQVLALLGDAIFTLYIREKIIKSGINNANTIQKKVASYVSARGQVDILKKLIDQNILTEEEIDIIKRGRNNKNDNHPKNTKILTYKLSTGFEALLGSLYYDDKSRLQEILDKVEVE